MTDDDLIPWNPPHFGHVDFQKESDGQLTIFFEDTNEPPDPDDFASIADYEIAWIEWEQTQTLPQQEDTIMNFNITTSFDSEIEQLKAKLAELETQKHRISTCANRIVAQIGECVTEMKQMGVSDEILTDWACVIYKEITSEDTPITEDYGNNKTLEIDRLLGIIQANESAIDQVRNTWEEKENRWYKEREELEARLNDALQKVTNLTAAILRISDELNISKKTILELTTANQKLTEEVLELRGESPQSILTETQAEESEEDPRQNPEFLEATKNQEIVSEFLKKLNRTERVDRLVWRKIRELPLNPETMRELGLQINPKSKIHKYLLQQMPAMCAKYIEETGDNSDLDWLPGHFVESVQEALSESVGETKPPQLEIKPVFQRGDIVCLIEDLSSPSTILDINGEWVNVQDSDGLTDMWNISDICHLVAE